MRFFGRFALLLLLLALALAGCTGSGGDDGVGPSDSISADGNPSVTTVEETPGATADTGSDATASGPGTEAGTADSADAATDVESAEGAASQATEAAEDANSVTAAEAEDPEEPLPFLIDLGATKCIPCKMMAPILEELAETKSDYFEVIFYDVWEDRSKGQEFGIRAIPTQIFFSAQGEELFRHEGFYSRKQILDKWRDLGIDVGE